LHFSKAYILGLAYGGFAQFVAGMWELAIGDTFTALVFSSYGTFWISYAAILIPWFNIAAAYGDNVQEFQSAMGHFLMGKISHYLFMHGLLMKKVGLSSPDC
jgi:succinate-acetate transporter protein